jgi:hypothetical protein
MHSCVGPGRALVHNCDPAVFRTPRLGNGASELENGPNPANHLTGDMRAYVGTEDVAQSFASAGGYEPGYIRFQMHSSFEAVFGKGFNYAETGGTEWVIPVGKIDLFNQLTKSRTWVPFGG